MLQIQPLLGCTVNLDVYPPLWRLNTSSTIGTSAEIVQGTPYEVSMDTGMSTSIVNSQSIVHVLSPQWTSGATLSPTSAHADRVSSMAEKLLLYGLATGKGLDLATGPLWKVHIATHGPPENEKTTLVLVVHHAIADGVGARNLLAALLTELVAELRSAADKTLETPADAKILVPMPFPPANEDTLGLKLPSTPFRSEATPNIAQLLPEVVTATPIVYDTWPNPNIANTEPWTAAERVALLGIPAVVVKDAKDAARRKGVKTLHPVLQAVTLVALRVAFMKDDDQRYDDPEHPMQVKVGTPVSLRDEKLGHPSACGNFAASFTHDYPVTALRRSGLSKSASVPSRAGLKFWDVALHFAEDVGDLAKRKGAATPVFRMLAELPSASGSWEEWLMKKMVKSNAPFGGSIELSNLGLFATDAECSIEQEEGFEVAWAQTASVTGDSLTINVSFKLRASDAQRSISLHFGNSCICDSLFPRKVAH
jgi:hypothetical protein